MPLVALLRSRQFKTEQYAAAALSNLANQDPDYLHARAAMIAAGAVPLLVALLTSEEPQVQAAAAQASWHFALGYEQAQDAIIAANALPQLVMLLRSDQALASEVAANATMGLANEPGQNQPSVNYGCHHCSRCHASISHAVDVKSTYFAIQ